MKLSMEQHAELRKLARYFDKMEDMAEGMEAESAADTIAPKPFQEKKPLLEIAFRRRNMLMNSRSADEKISSPVPLTLIVNEERF